jgi:hypothetical protein
MDEKVRKSLANINRELAGLSPEDLAEFAKRFKRHSASARLDAHHSVRTALLPFPEVTCTKIELIVLSGRDTTDKDGKARLFIDSLLCGVKEEQVSELVMTREPYFVATAQGSRPAFATVQISSSTTAPAHPYFLVDRDDTILENGYLTDVTVEITTWKPDGTPAADKTFSWVCAIEAATLVSIGG